MCDVLCLCNIALEWLIVFAMMMFMDIENEGWPCVMLCFNMENDFGSWTVTDASTCLHIEKEGWPW